MARRTGSSSTGRSHAWPAECDGRRYNVLPLSAAYGCTQPFFLIREPFQARTTMFRYDGFRRPGFWQVDLNFAKTTPITDHMRFQSVSKRSTCSTARCTTSATTTDTNSADFGRINRNMTAQSNFQRFIQLGFRLIF